MLARLVTAVAAALFVNVSAAAASAAIALPIAVVAEDADAVASGAPSMSVNPDVLVQGGTATISYSNPKLAGQTIVVDIDNGRPRNTQTATIEITLDADGNGCATWAVPAWDFAAFNAPGVAEIACVVAR